MDHLPIGGAGFAFRKIFGANPDLLHQQLRVASQLADEIGKETQDPGMHDVEDFAGVGILLQQRSLTHCTPRDVPPAK
jgi:hypothetical protein